GHHPRLFLRLHPAVDETDAAVRKDLLGEALGHRPRSTQLRALLLVDERVDDQRLPPRTDLAPHPFVEPGAIRLPAHERHDGSAAGPIAIWAPPEARAASRDARSLPVTEAVRNATR